MNGAHSLVKTLLAAGVDTCFANPGTSEMHFVAALDEIPGMHCVLGLQENVVTGMADGYFRIAGKPACTLLHCGPGLANGFANLHNARRARSGIVNIVGDQATYHRPFDAPLTADTDLIARAASNWVRTSTRSADVGGDAAAAVQAARMSQVATLILPSDASWEEGGVAAPALPDLQPPAIDLLALETCLRALRGNGKVLLLLGGRAVLSEGLQLAWRVAQASGASLMCEYGVARVARGQGRVPIDRVPYAGSAAAAALAPFDHILLIAANAPVAFFAYPGQPSFHQAPRTQLHTLARVDQDPRAALQMLVDAIGAPDAAAPDPGPRPSIATGAPTPEGLARTVAALMPENAIVSDESVSYGRGFYPHTRAAAPHDWLHLTGGAIGDGLPVATGAALAGSGRGVISLQADGSAMYSLQSLWTQAREKLPCTTIILSNRKYNILIGEYEAVGAEPGATAMSMLDLGNPDLDWVSLAKGMGVEAAVATTMEQCADLMAQSFGRDGPFLIELVV
ncbi:MAG: acetolactate synthase large subunit [Burkholderiales bacterium]